MVEVVCPPAVVVTVCCWANPTDAESPTNAAASTSRLRDRMAVLRRGISKLPLALRRAHVMLCGAHISWKYRPFERVGPEKSREKSMRVVGAGIAGTGF